MTALTRTSLDHKIKTEAVAKTPNEDKHPAATSATPAAIHPRVTTNVTDTTTKHAANAVVTVRPPAAPATTKRKGINDTQYNQHPGDATAKPNPRSLH